MANEGLKTQMFRQAIMETSTVAKETLGTLRILDDGRKFRYAKNGAGALQAGLIVQALPFLNANHTRCAVATTVAGKSSVTVTLGATAATANYYAEGFLQIAAGANGIGVQYKILSHPAADASATLVVQLAEPLILPLTNGTHTVSLLPNQYTGLTVATGLVQPVVGVTPRPVAANAFFWLQTGGVCALEQDTTTALGAVVVATGNGEAAIGTNWTGPFIGYMLGGTATADEASPVMLTLD